MYLLDHNKVQFKSYDKIKRYKKSIKNTIENPPKR